MTDRDRHDAGLMPWILAVYAGAAAAAGVGILTIALIVRRIRRR